MIKCIRKSAATALVILVLLGTGLYPVPHLTEVNAAPVFEETEEVPIIGDGAEMPVFEENEGHPVFVDKTEKTLFEREPETSIIKETSVRQEGSDLDFSSMRLLVKSKDEGIFFGDDKPVASYGEIHLLQYDSEEETQRAYRYYLEKAESVEADAEMMIAEDEEPVLYSDSVMTQEENPFTELEEAVSRTDPGEYDIALIDTGLKDAENAVSVIGEEAGDDHGHGTLVAERIREQNPNARILSVKALDENGHGTISSVYAAFEYIKMQNVKIINLSMSAGAADDSKILEEAACEAVSRGILVVGAAGNQSRNASEFFPGCIESARVIGAANGDGTRNPISNFGETVDYYAASDSTSEAAGIMSGWFSLYKERDMKKVLNKGQIFAPDYVEKKTGEKLEEAAKKSEGERKNSLQEKPDAETILSVAAEKFNKKSITTKKWEDIQPHIEKWIQKNIPYRSPCSGLIDWKNETAYGLDCSGFVNAMVHLYYDDGKISYDWSGSWFASAVWPVGLEAAGLKVLKDSGKKTFNDAYGKGMIKDGDIVVFSNALFRGVHVAIICGKNQAGEPLLAHAYGAKLQKTTFNNVYDWDFPETGSGTYSYYEIFRGTPANENESFLTVSKKISESEPLLVVRNTLKGNIGDTGKEFVFTVFYTPYGEANAKTEKFTLKGGEEKKLKCKPKTAYKVTEASYAGEGYTTEPASRTYSGKIPSNTEKKRKFQFTISYVKPGKKKATTETIKLAGGEKKTISVKPKSSYCITEEPPSGKWKSAGETKQSGKTGGEGTTIAAGFKNTYTYDAVNLSFVNHRSAGFLFLEKSSSNDSITNGNRCYSLAGAKYAVYKKDASLNSEDSVRMIAQPGGKGCDAGLSTYAVQNDGRVGTFYVDEKGDGCPIGTDGSGTKGTSLSLLAGEYYVVETASAKNYDLDPEIMSVSIRENETIRLARIGNPSSSEGIEIEKKNANPEYARAATLSGTQFSICYYDNTEGDVSGVPLKTWILNVKASEESGNKVETSEAAADSLRYLAKMLPGFQEESGSDEFYYDEKTKQPVIPVGTISVEESLTAPGYTKTNAKLFDDQKNEVLLSDGKFIGIIRKEGEKTHLTTGNFYTMFNTPVEIYTNAVYVKSEGHYVKSSDYLMPDAGPVTIQDTVTLKGTDAEKKKEGEEEKNSLRWILKGKLYDSISGELISSSQTEPFIPESFDGTKKELLFNVDHPEILEGHILYVAEELYYYDGEEEILAAFEDEKVFGDAMTEEEKENQRIHFTKVRAELVTEDGVKETAAAKMLKLTDRISFNGLIRGHRYRVKGILMDGEKEEVLTDDQGKEIVSEQEFTAEETDGMLELKYLFPAVSMSGKKIVSYEQIYENHEEIANHADIQEKAHTVDVLPVKIGTVFVNKEDSSHELIEGKIANLTDIVSIENAVPEACYELTGTIMDWKSKKPLFDPNGKTYTKTVKIVLKETNGNAENDFKVAAECFQGGGTLVAYEELCYVDPETERRVLLAEHKDLNDENQTVRLPSLATKLSLEDSSGIFQDEGEIDLQDEVELHNLKKNETYTVRGYLVNRESGNYLKKDGSETKEKEKACCGTFSFLAEQSKEIVQVPFSINAGNIDFDIVCFEELYMLKTAANGKQSVEIVAKHAELDNELQTVRFANPKTGDSAQLLFWILSAAGGAAVLFMTVGIWKEKRKNK